MLGNPGNCTWILRVYTRSRRKHPTDTWSLQSRNARDAAGAGTSVPPHPRGTAQPRTGAPTARAPTPPVSALGPQPGEAGRRWGRGRGARPAHSRTPGGRAWRGSPGERMLGAGPRWGRGPLPGLSLTAWLSSRAGLRGGPRSGSQPRVSPPEAQRPAGTRGAVDKSARAEGVQRAELRGWEGWDGRAHRYRRGDTTDTALAGSSQARKLRVLLPHPPPAPPTTPRPLKE